MDPNAFFENNPEQAAASGYQQGTPAPTAPKPPAATPASLEIDAMLSKQGSLHVDTLALQSLQSQLSSYVTGLFATSLPQLSASVHELDTTWEGPNHTRFMTYFDERMEAVRLHQQVLEHYLDAFGKAIAIYKTLETDVESRVGSMTKAIDGNIYYGDSYGY